MTSELLQEEAELPQVMSLLCTTTYEQHVPGQQQFAVAAWKNTPSSRSATLRAHGWAAQQRPVGPRGDSRLAAAQARPRPRPKGLCRDPLLSLW